MRSSHALLPAFQLLTALLGFGLCAAAAAEVGTWDRRLGASRVVAEVFALAPARDGALFIGGRFGGIPGNPKAAVLWRNGEWSPLGIPPTDGVTEPVLAAATIGTNTYFGGEFSASNEGVRLNGVARWDGTAIHALGSGPLAGVQGQVYALASLGTDLIVAGRFRSLGTLPATNIARWNGSAWSTFGTGLGDGDNDRVSALTNAPDGTLYAGGNFLVAGTKPVRRLARWDGTQWSEVGGGANGFVQALAWHDGQLYVGGVFDQVGTNKIANLARWDGTNWFALGTGVDGEVNALTVIDGKLFVGGAFTKAGGLAANGVAAWNGASWESLSTGFSGGGPTVVRTLLVNGGRLFAGGNFYKSGSTRVPYVATWDGIQWNPLEYGLEGGESPRVTALDAQGGSVTVGGNFTYAGGLTVGRVARWDGGDWQAMGAGFDTPPLALAHGPGGEIYAGGEFSTSGRRIARWNGSSWSSLGGGVTGEGTVWSITVSTNGDVYAGGIFVKVGGVNALGIARWNGLKWSALGEGIANYGVAGTVYAMAFVGNDLYAGGMFNTAGGIPVNNLARWNGTTWSDPGGGVSVPGFLGTIHALAPYGSGLLVGGNFSLADQKAYPFLAAWNPDSGTWSQLAGAPNGIVRSIVTFDGRIHVGGDFTSIAGTVAPGLARWDGASWSSVGGGLGGNLPTAAQLSADGTNLWVAGPFTQVGGQRAVDLARWWVPYNTPPIVSFAAPAEGAVFAAGVPVSLQLEASDPEGGPLSIDLFQNGIPLTTLAGPPFQYSWADVFPDTYILEAVATDASGKRSAPATRILTVTPPAGDLPPTIALTSPSTGTLLVGQPFTISAVANDPDGQVIRADFYRDSKLLGSSDSAPFQLKVPGLPAGDVQLIAVAVDNLGAKATSAPVAIQLVAGQPPVPKWSYASSADVRGSVAIATNGLIHLSLGPGLNNLVCLRPDGSTQWTYRDGGPFLSNPAIGRNGDILAGRFDGRLLCVSAEGKRRWEFSTGGFIRNAPAIARDGTIYFGSDNQLFYALDPDGNKLWQFPTSAATGDSAPAIAADGAILFGTADGILYCLNTNGTKRWQLGVPGSINSSPALADDGTIHFVSSIGSLFAIEPDGRVRWEYKSASTSLGGSPVIGPDGTLYFGTTDGNLHAVSSTGVRQWTYKTDDAISGTPAVDREGTILVASNDRRIHAVFPTGVRKWVFTTDSPSGGSVSVAPDGTILVGSSDQHLYALAGSAPLSDRQWPKFHRDLAQTGRGSLLPTVVLDQPTTGGHFLTSQSVHFLAHASSSNGPIAYVEFRIGDEVLGRKDTAPFEFDWNNPPAGAFRVNARAVDAFGASAVSESARILIAAGGAAPKIVTPPQPATVGPGENLSLSVEMLSASPITYQWLKDGSQLAGATGATLSLSPTTSSMSAQYAVIARNSGGSVTSAPVLVTVLLPPNKYWRRQDGNDSSVPPSIGPSGYLYTGGNPGGIRAHDRAGTLVWMNTAANPSSDIAIANDGTLFFGMGNGRLVSMDPDGRILWSNKVSGRVTGIALTGDATIYITTDPGSLEAWSRTGTNRWVHEVGFAILSAPVVAQDGTILFSAFDGKLHAVNPSGQPVWTYNAEAFLERTPAIAPDGSIVLPVGSRMLALNPGGTHRWTYTAEGKASTPCIGPDGSIYFGVTDARNQFQPAVGRVVALKPDGGLRWSTEVPSPVITAPSLASDGVVFAAAGPELFALNPNGTWRSRFAAQGKVTSATIGFDGTLYFCDTSGALNAIGGTKAMPTNGWPSAGRDVRHRSDASSPTDPDEFFFPVASNGFDGPVNSITAVPNGIYVAGEFTIAGGRPANHVAFWNRTNWFACNGRPEGPVTQVLAVGTDLFARGSFSNAPGAYPRPALRWDGLNWYPADEGLIEFRGPMAKRGDELFAIGEAKSQAEPGKAYLLRHDGTRWNPVGQPLPVSTVHSLRDGPSGFHAAAGSRVYRFDGTNWSPVGPSLGEEVYVAMETPLGLFAGGNFHNEANNSGFVARWNGTNWVGVGSGLGQAATYFGTAFLMASRGNELLVGGFFNAAGPINTPGLARWDGTNWTSLLATGFVSSESSGGPAALEIQDDAIYVGGSFLRLNGDSNLRYFGALEGGNWRALGPRLLILDGQLQLMLFNFLGRPYAVEISTDLRTWSQLYLYSNLDKPVSISIPKDDGGNSRFIRVVEP